MTLIPTVPPQPGTNPSPDWEKMPTDTGDCPPWPPRVFYMASFTVLVCKWTTPSRHYTTANWFYLTKSTYYPPLFQSIWKQNWSPLSLLAPSTQFHLLCSFLSSTLADSLKLLYWDWMCLSKKLFFSFAFLWSYWKNFCTWKTSITLPKGFQNIYRHILKNPTTQTCLKHVTIYQLDWSKLLMIIHCYPKNKDWSTTFFLQIADKNKMKFRVLVGFALTSARPRTSRFTTRSKLTLSHSENKQLILTGKYEELQP